MTDDTLSAAQVRKARKLLCWSRDRLAARMGISIHPLIGFEKYGVVARAFDPHKAREVFEAAGVEFGDDSDRGASVRLGKATPKRGF